jgi:hypothetical protein
MAYSASSPLRQAGAGPDPIHGRSLLTATGDCGAATSSSGVIHPASECAWWQPNSLLVIIATRAGRSGPGQHALLYRMRQVYYVSCARNLPMCMHGSRELGTRGILQPGFTCNYKEAPEKGEVATPLPVSSRVLPPLAWSPALPSHLPAGATNPFFCTGTVHHN